MINSIIKYAAYFFGLILIQVLVLNNVQLSGFINPYIYVLFILILPFEVSGWILLTTAFLMGLSIDVFPQGAAGGGGTLGIHTASTVLMAFLRPTVLRWINPRGDYEKGTEPSIMDYGFAWYLLYSGILVGIHHLFLFYLEDFSFLHFFNTLLRYVVSLFFTLLLILIWEGFRYRPRLS